MNYLMYVKGGVIKKFPLTKPQVFIGRGQNCDIVLDEPVVSKTHCRVETFVDFIRIVDLKSKNGIFIDQNRIEEAKITVNNSFGIGDTEFYFRRGDIKEFAISRELSGIIVAMTQAKRPEKRHDDTETRDEESKLFHLLPLLAEKAILIDDFPPFIQFLQEIIGCVITLGTLVLLHNQKPHMIFNHLGIPISDDLTSRITPVDEGEIHFTVYDQPVPFIRFCHTASESCLVYLYQELKPKARAPLVDFFNKLLEIIHLHLRLLSSIQFDPTPAPVLFQGPGISIIGHSSAMKQLVDMIAKIAPKSTFVLIMGESGTGKELFARMIHQLSGRKQYVAINCAAIPSTLLESELFGYEAGAFTDARKRKTGKIEESSGGTLVLDEIGDMPLEIQAKILRVIQEKSVTRLGSNDLIPVDLRIIAMTNHDLYQLVETRQFRHDLFYRLRIHEMTIPALRDRREDIPGLVMHFTRLYAERNQVNPAGFAESVFECFQNYPWPGNIRELENEIMKIMELIDNQELIGNQHLTPSILNHGKPPADITPPENAGFKEKVGAFEREEIKQLLEKHQGNKSEAARAIGITYQGLLKKMRKLGMD